MIFSSHECRKIKCILRVPTVVVDQDEGLETTLTFYRWRVAKVRLMLLRTCEQGGMFIVTHLLEWGWGISFSGLIRSTRILLGKCRKPCIIQNFFFYARRATHTHTHSLSLSLSFTIFRIILELNPLLISNQWLQFNVYDFQL
jgi:hypothetical protein